MGSLPTFVLDYLPLGVVVLNRAGEVVLYNRYEEQLARRRREDVIGRHFFQEVAACSNVPHIAGEFERRIDDNSLEVDVEHKFDLPFHPRPRDVRLLFRSFAGGREPHAVLVIEDITVRRELQRERERLVSAFVHDLRSPLAGALGYAELIEIGDFGPLANEQQREAVRTIRDTCDRMHRLIVSTLDEIRPAGVAPPPGPVNLHALVLSGISAILPAARERAVAVFYNGRVDRAEFPTLAITVRGHVERLGTIVDNLLSNAVKYARSEIHVSLTSEDGRVVLQVADDGPGVAPDQVARIFEHGVQAPGAAAGHGIGLASALDAVCRHNGELELLPSRKGAVFQVTLPA